MKRFLCLFLVAVLCFGLFGCGDNTVADDEDDVRGKIIKEDSEKVDDSSDNENDEDDVDFSLGKASGNTYVNEFLGIRCTLPSDWDFYSEKQILEMNNLVGDYMDEDAAEALKNANIIYDMYASQGTTGNSININLEKPSPLQLNKYTIKQLLEGQIDTIRTTFGNMGYTDVNIAYQKIKINGKNYDSLKLSANMQGMDFYSTMICFRKGDYLANISIGSLLTDNTDTFLGYFEFS